MCYNRVNLREGTDAALSDAAGCERCSVMKTVSRILLYTLNVIALILGFDCAMRVAAVDRGILDYSGQGRNEYGR